MVSVLEPCGKHGHTAWWQPPLLPAQQQPNFPQQALWKSSCLSVLNNTISNALVLLLFVLGCHTRFFRVFSFFVTRTRAAHIKKNYCNPHIPHKTGTTRLRWLACQVWCGRFSAATCLRIRPSFHRANINTFVVYHLLRIHLIVTKQR